MQICDVKIEIATRSESVRYLGQLITFQHQETTEIKNRIRAAWATFHKYRQELTSKNYMLKHRLRLFDAGITPTICYASGTWAPTKEHERMLQCNEKCSVSSYTQKEDTKRSRNTKLRTPKVSTTLTRAALTTRVKTEKAIHLIMIKTVTCHSRFEAFEKMENEKIKCLKLTQRKIKWRLAMRMATSQKERWLIKDINKHWINTAQDRGRWTLLEENYTKNSVTRTRRNSHNRPARYDNGVKLNDEEIADIT